MQDKIFKAIDAKLLLDNPLLKASFAGVEEYINSKELHCDPDDKDMAQRLIISKQLLASIKREITRIIDDGAVAQIKMKELEKRSTFSSIFRR